MYRVLFSGGQWPFGWTRRLDHVGWIELPNATDGFLFLSLIFKSNHHHPPDLATLH